MSHEQARKAYEARRNAIEELRALDAEIGDNEPTAEQDEQFERINKAIDQSDKDTEKALRNIQLEERSNFLDGLIGEQADEGKKDERDGMTPIEKEARSLFLPSDHPDARSALQIGATSAEMHQIMRRDLTAGTATDGAELVPTTLFGTLYTYLREGATSMFSLGRDIVTQSGEDMDFPTNTAYSTAILVAEAAALTESDPQFANVTLGVYKYGLMIQISSELEEDQAVPGALPWVIDQAVDGIRRGVGAHLITGTGSGQPDGVDNGSTTSTATGVTYPTTDNLIDATHDIVSGYRRDAVWVFNDDTVKGIRKLKDGDSNYIWAPGLTVGSPDMMLGAPVFTDDSLATVGANAKLGVYGDLRRGYLVRTVANIRAERSVDYAFANDLLTWRFIGRFGGEILDNNAYTVITNEAS